MIDLHTHTVFSDGADTPEELLAKAETLNLSYLAITDHNSVGAYRHITPATAAGLYHGHIIPGTEITCMYHGEIVEVLGYGFRLDEMERRLSETVLPGEEKQRREARLIAEAFTRAGVPFAWENICFDPSRESSRRAFWRELKRSEENRRFLSSPLSWETSSAFTRQEIYNPASPLYVDESSLYPTVAAAVSAIHAAGGLAFLAHLYVYAGAASLRAGLEQFVEKYGLDGVECAHSSFTEEQIGDLERFCEENGLLRSGGSDYHGSRKPDVSLGTGRGQLRISPDYLAQWPEAARKIQW